MCNTEENSESYRDVFALKDDPEELNKFLATTLTDKRWGDALSVRVGAEVLGIDIVLLVSPTRQTMMFSAGRVSLGDSRKVAYIGNINNRHFCALTNKDCKPKPRQRSAMYLEHPNPQLCVYSSCRLSSCLTAEERCRLFGRRGYLQLVYY